MILTGRHLQRRTFLKGMGATLALPLLDAMTPALAAAFVDFQRSWSAVALSSSRRVT